MDSTAAKTFHRLASVAIGALSDGGYLLDPLDWDVKGQKYTLRIRGANREPMVAVGLITFRRKDGAIVLTDAVTGTQAAFPLKENAAAAFSSFSLEFAQRLREEAAYSRTGF